MPMPLVRPAILRALPISICRPCASTRHGPTAGGISASSVTAPTITLRPKTPSLTTSVWCPMPRRQPPCAGFANLSLAKMNRRWAMSSAPSLWEPRTIPATRRSSATTKDSYLPDWGDSKKRSPLTAISRTSIFPATNCSWLSASRRCACLSSRKTPTPPSAP